MDVLMAFQVGAELYHVMRIGDINSVMVMTLMQTDPVSDRSWSRTEWTLYDVDYVWVDADESRSDLMKRHGITSPA